MTEKPITDLRRRMLQDMTNRNFGAKTPHDYIRHIETFAKFLGRAPDTATGDDIRRFQAEHIAQGTQPPKMNTQESALRHETAPAARPLANRRVIKRGPARLRSWRRQAALPCSEQSKLAIGRSEWPSSLPSVPHRACARFIRWKGAEAAVRR